MREMNVHIVVVLTIIPWMYKFSLTGIHAETYWQLTKTKKFSIHKKHACHDHVSLVQLYFHVVYSVFTWISWYPTYFHANISCVKLKYYKFDEFSIVECKNIHC